MRKRIGLFIVCLLSFCSLWLIIVSERKGQNSPHSIQDANHNPSRFGRIESIQVDSSGDLYIWLSNCDIVRIDPITMEEAFFHYGYNSLHKYKFAIQSDKLLFYGSKLEVFDKQGNYLFEAESCPEVIANSREVAFRDVIYQVRQNGILDEVWKTEKDMEQRIYYRLACTEETVALILVLLFIPCFLLLLKEFGVRLKWNL